VGYWYIVPPGLVIPHPLLTNFLQAFIGSINQNCVKVVRLLGALIKAVEVLIFTLSCARPSVSLNLILPARRHGFDVPVM
jgi:hypothetical protein